MRSRPPDARDSPSSDSSWPGTNSWASTRAGRRAATRSARVTHSASDGSATGAHRRWQRRAGEPAAAWRSAARVDSAPWFSLRPSRCSPSSRRRWPGRRAGPRRRCRRGTSRGQVDPVGEAVLAGEPERPRAGVGERGGLDRLLVELRAGLARARPPTGVTDRWPSRVSTVEQPVQQPQPVGDESSRRPVPHRRRSAPRAGPRSRSAGRAPATATAARQRGRPIVDRRRRPAGHALRCAGQHAEHIGGAERGERHRVAVRRAPARRRGERGEGASRSRRRADARRRRRRAPRGRVPSSLRRWAGHSSARSDRAGCGTVRRAPARPRRNVRYTAARSCSSAGAAPGSPPPGRARRRRRSSRGGAGARYPRRVRTGPGRR